MASQTKSKSERPHNSNAVRTLSVGELEVIKACGHVHSGDGHNHTDTQDSAQIVVDVDGQEQRWALEDWEDFVEVGGFE